MNLKQGTLVAVMDGAKLKLFSNTVASGPITLVEQPARDVSMNNKGSGGRHFSSSANPSDSQQTEDAFAAGVAEMLNQLILDGKIEDLVVIAAPRSLGELRKHYHKNLKAKLAGEIAKDLTGHSIADIEHAIVAH